MKYNEIWIGFDCPYCPVHSTVMKLYFALFRCLLSQLATIIFDTRTVPIWELMVLAMSAYVLHLYCTGSSLFAIVIVYRSLIVDVNTLMCRVCTYINIYTLLWHKDDTIDDDDDNRARRRYEPIREEAGQVPLSGECGWWHRAVEPVRHTVLFCDSREGRWWQVYQA